MTLTNVEEYSNRDKLGGASSATTAALVVATTLPRTIAITFKLIIYWFY